MKRLFCILFPLFLISCGTTNMVETSMVKEPNGAERLNKKMEDTTLVSGAKYLQFTDTKRIGEIMGYLASDDLKGRDSGSEGIEMAARYIEDYFRTYKVAPYYPEYRDTLSNYRKTSFNVVGMVAGSDPKLKDEFIMIGAHYDHIGIIKIENGDAIANGANDNASGTTSVMELARYFGTNRTNKRSLIFALFSAEEKGLLGSKHMAKRMKADSLNLYTMLNFEMTGVPLRGKDYTVYITGFKKSNLAEVSNKYAQENLVGYLPTAREFNLFQRSDNYPFHKEFGIPSHTFCTFDFTNFAFYHRVGDENELMDFNHMATLVNKLIPVVEGIANANTQEVKIN